MPDWKHLRDIATVQSHQKHLEGTHHGHVFRLTYNGDG